jgi:hypothetical protein
MHDKLHFKKSREREKNEIYIYLRSINATKGTYDKTTKQETSNKYASTFQRIRFPVLVPENI